MILTKIRRFLQGEEGQGMTEYIIIVALIAIAAIGIFVLFGDQIRAIMDGIVRGLTGEQVANTNSVTVTNEGGRKTIKDFGSW